MVHPEAEVGQPEGHVQHPDRHVQGSAELRGEADDGHLIRSQRIRKSCSEQKKSGVRSFLTFLKS